MARLFSVRTSSVAVCVLRVCGRARCVRSGPRGAGSASMSGAWVGPLNWIQWAGGHRRLNPRGRRTGPGGGQRLPDCGSSPPASLPVSCPLRGARHARPGRSWPKSDGPAPPGNVTRARQKSCQSAIHGGAFTFCARYPEAPLVRHCHGSMVPSDLRTARTHPAVRPRTAGPGSVGAYDGLSTGCGGGDAVAGGLEQCRREVRCRGDGRCRGCARGGAHRPPRRLPAAVGRPRSALGGRRLAARRDPRGQRGGGHPARGARLLRRQ